MDIILKGRAYPSQDMIGLRIELLGNNGSVITRITNASHYGFIANGVEHMINWYSEDITWRWVDRPTAIG